MKTKMVPQGNVTAIRRKLYSAVSMLLVSGIMMVSSSYAWFVMSTAPEVTGIDTQVGANGALEIALLNQQSWDNLDLLDAGDIDENATEQTTESNLRWGNLVDLKSTTYGLDKITLLPARLNISEGGTDEDGNLKYTIANTLLKTPIYGEDGRVKGLAKDKAVAKVYAENKFGTNGYGVRAIGTAANMSEFQLGMNSVRSQITTNMATASNTASKALSQNGNDLATIVVRYALADDKSSVTYGKSDVEAVKRLAVAMQDSLGYIETALRQAYAGYITTADSGVTLEKYADELAWINDSSHPLADIKGKYPNAKSVISAIDTYVDKLIEDQTKVKNAITQCDNKINELGETGTCTWGDLSAIITPLVNTNEMTLGGKKLDEVKESIKDENGNIDVSAALELVGGGIVIVVPTGSGILSDIADFAGDYTANVKVEHFSYGEIIKDQEVKATMQTDTKENPVYLAACNNALMKATLTTAEGNEAITDFYGYAIDLAFRTNAANSHLQLQTEPENRVYTGSEDNPALQGGGSYMVFQSNAGLSATKMVKLMSGVRVVFMDGNQKVLAMAVLDTTLGKDAYTVFSAEDQKKIGAYAYLNGLTTEEANYQQSDLITEENYNKLVDTSAVTFDKTAGTITAKLYLHGFSMTEVIDERNEETKEVTKSHLTGGIDIKEKQTSPAITALTQDTPKKVTAVVYLDGSVVNNSMVAASSAQSMVGKLNLQFSSDASLIPAENTELHNGKTTTP